MVMIRKPDFFKRKCSIYLEGSSVIKKKKGKCKSKIIIVYNNNISSLKSHQAVFFFSTLYVDLVVDCWSSLNIISSSNHHHHHFCFIHNSLYQRATPFFQCVSRISVVSQFNCTMQLWIFMRVTRNNMKIFFQIKFLLNYL